VALIETICISRTSKFSPEPATYTQHLTAPIKNKHLNYLSTQLGNL